MYTAFTWFDFCTNSPVPLHMCPVPVQVHVMPGRLLKCLCCPTLGGIPAYWYEPRWCTLDLQARWPTCKYVKVWFKFCRMIKNCMGDEKSDVTAARPGAVAVAPAATAAAAAARAAAQSAHLLQSLAMLARQMLPSLHHQTRPTRIPGDPG